MDIHDKWRFIAGKIIDQWAMFRSIPLPEGVSTRPPQIQASEVGDPVSRAVFFGGSIHNTPVLMMECPHSLCELNIYIYIYTYP